MNADKDFDELIDESNRVRISYMEKSKHMVNKDKDNTENNQRNDEQSKIKVEKGNNKVNKSYERDDCHAVVKSQVVKGRTNTGQRSESNEDAAENSANDNCSKDFHDKAESSKPIGSSRLQRKEEKVEMAFYLVTPQF